MFKLVFENMVVICTAIMLGVYLERRKVINVEVSKSMGDIALNFAMPCTIIASLQKPFRLDLLHSGIVVLIATIFMHLLFMVLGYLVCKLIKIEKSKIMLVVFALTFTNLGYMGFPVVSNVLGSGSDFYCAIALGVFNIMVFTIGIKLIKGKSGEKFAIGSIFNSVVVSTIIGGIFFVTGITLPKPVMQALNMIGSLTSPLALIVTGAILSRSNVQIKNFNFKFFIILLSRLLILPILFFAILHVFVKDAEILKIVCILGAMPSGTIITIFVQKYGKDVKLSSEIVLASTVLSVISVPIFTSLLYKFI